MPYAEDDPLGDIYTPAMSVNRIMRDHGHKFIYDYATLRIALEAAQFVDVIQQQYGRSSDQALLGLDTPERAIESLYVEARKA